MIIKGSQPPKHQSAAEERLFLFQHILLINKVRKSTNLILMVECEIRVTLPIIPRQAVPILSIMSYK